MGRTGRSGGVEGRGFGLLPRSPRPLRTQDSHSAQWENWEYWEYWEIWEEWEEWEDFRPLPLIKISASRLSLDGRLTKPPLHLLAGGDRFGGEPQGEE